jgi:hemoglobin
MATGSTGPFGLTFVRAALQGPAMSRREHQPRKERRNMKRGSLYGLLCLALVAGMLVPSLRASPAFAAEGAQASGARRAASKKHVKKPPAGPSLYERLGGINNIAPLVDDVIERSYASEVFKANPLIEEAHKRFPKAVYKYNATSLACMVMGGPQKYTGRSLKEAHQHLQVTEKEWQELLSIFRASMDSFRVPPKEQGEIIAIIESTKGDVVVGAKSAVNP